MTQRFRENGTVVPVTVVQAGPCTVAQIRTMEKDGYRAVQVGFGERKHPTKALQGHTKGLAPFRDIAEFRSGAEEKLKRGDVLTVAIFKPGDRVAVTSISKGKGFQGVVKRHGFAGGRGSHGNKDQLRMPGSIGATDAARVFKGKRMAGQMGNSRVTTKNLEIIEIDTEKNLLFIKGALPGARSGLVRIYGDGEIDLSSQKETKEPAEGATEAKTEEQPKEPEKKPKEQENTSDKTEGKSVDKDQEKVIDKK